MTVLLRAGLTVAMAISVGACASAGQGAWPGECGRAANLIQRGQSRAGTAGAMATLQSCDPRRVSEAIASAVPTYSAEADTAVLREFWHWVDVWRDSAILDAALAQAGGRRIAAPQRVFAVRHLLMLTNPFHVYDYAGLTRGDRVDSTAALIITASGCGEGMTSHQGDRVGTPLPPDYREKIAAVLTSLAASPDQPASVRNAARCGVRR